MELNSPHYEVGINIVTCTPYATADSRSAFRFNHLILITTSINNYCYLLTKGTIILSLYYTKDEVRSFVDLLPAAKALTGVAVASYEVWKAWCHQMEIP